MALSKCQGNDNPIRKALPFIARDDNLDLPVHQNLLKNGFKPSCLFKLCLILLWQEIDSGLFHLSGVKYEKIILELPVTISIVEMEWGWS